MPDCNNSYDLAFGGAFYAFVIDQFNFDCTQEYHNELIDKGMLIKIHVQIC